MQSFFSQSIINPMNVTYTFYLPWTSNYGFQTLTENAELFSTVKEFSSQQTFSSDQSDQKNQCFQPKVRKSIIINGKNWANKKVIKQQKEQKQIKKQKQLNRKPSQKQSRNVTSNLLRIFFKNVIEIQLYNHLIDNIIQTQGMNCSRSIFYEWLSSFGVNFKNYVRLSELRKILLIKQSKDCQIIIRILLEKYLNGVALSHCLTSKRIERNSIKMHLQGLRLLRNDVLTILQKLE